MPLHLSRMRSGEEVFTWERNSGEIVRIATGRLVTYLAGINAPVTQINIDPPLVRAVSTQNGVEAEHLDRIGPNRLSDPVVFVRDEDDAEGRPTHYLIDGSHRLLARARLGLPTVPAWMVENERVWRRFCVDGFPGEPDAWRRYLADWNPDSPLTQRTRAGKPHPQLP